MIVLCNGEQRQQTEAPVPNAEIILIRVDIQFSLFEVQFRELTRDHVLHIKKDSLCRYGTKDIDDVSIEGEANGRGLLKGAAGIFC